MRTQFQRIFFDITGNCNAKCPWCMSGLYAIINKNFITPETFTKILDVLKANNALAPNGVLALYLWGEPFIHPKLNELCQIINNYPFPYSFSTNASKVPKIDKTFVKNLDHIIFSMPGFSQNAYDREHGFKFDKIKQNVETIVKECRAHGYRKDFIIGYHVYQFNLEELPQCEEWANKLNISFRPGYAIINNWWHVNGWIDNTLKPDVLKKISEDLFCFDIEKKIKDYYCPQYNLLAVDELGNVLNCCQVPKEKAFFRGNLLTDNYQDILSARIKNDVCKKCTESGLAYYLNNSLNTPKFYRRSLSQTIKYWQTRVNRAILDPQRTIKILSEKLHAKTS